MNRNPYIIVLGIAQDGGIPHAGTGSHPGWEDVAERSHAVCLGIVDPAEEKRWMVEATPDFRQQLYRLDETAPVEKRPGLEGVAITHAHIGHYTGLMFFGRESLNTRSVPVYVLPKMGEFLKNHAPWEGLVRNGNIDVKVMRLNEEVPLSTNVSIRPVTVPHRDEYSETAGFIIRGPERSVLFIPDIDSWDEFDAWGVHIEGLIAEVDRAYLDGTFFSGEELPGLDLSKIPHPFIMMSMERFGRLSDGERGKICFIHFNHSNPVLIVEGEERDEVRRRGFDVAREGETFSL